MAFNKMRKAGEKISKAIKYITNDEKTTLTVSYTGPDGKKESKDISLVSGIYCNPNNAVNEMNSIKRFYNKRGQITAYHIVQSFKPGEINPMLAHQIGLETMKAFLKGDYQAVLATHFVGSDTQIHNHIIVNSVSFTTGKKLPDKFAQQENLREISDKICLDYGLSTIVKTDNGNKQYLEARDSKSGKTTKFTILKKALDEAIAMSSTYEEFLSYLAKYDYEIDADKGHPEIKSPHFNKSTWLSAIGEDYTINRIKERLGEKDKVIPKAKIQKPIPKPKSRTMNDIYNWYLNVLNLAYHDPEGYRYIYHFFGDDLYLPKKLVAKVKYINDSYKDLSIRQQYEIMSGKVSFEKVLKDNITKLDSQYDSLCTKMEYHQKKLKEAKESKNEPEIIKNRNAIFSCRNSKVGIKRKQDLITSIIDDRTKMIKKVSKILEATELQFRRNKKLNFDRDDR